MQLSQLIKGIQQKNKLCISKALTLLESSKPDDFKLSVELLKQVNQQYLQQKNLRASSKRIGICGPPGAGKSCSIDKLGLQILNSGQSLAVLAVDPSSQFSGGSLLGDRTRMIQLMQREEVFIRPSPSKAYLGGLAPSTSDNIFLLEKGAFYENIIVESVGIGQNEVFIDSVVDCVILILHPGAGDMLQAQKRGVMEAADIICFNKADGILKEKAIEMCSQFSYMNMKPKYQN